MANDLATLTVASVPASVGSCELCAAEGVALVAAAVVRHSRGGAVQLAACDRCARAMRRLVAVVGASPMAVETARLEPPVVMVARSPEPAVVAAAVVQPGSPPVTPTPGPGRVVAELTSEVVSTDGRSWGAYVYGEPRGDASWIGWLEFREVGGAGTLRTRQETSQPDLGALTYWAGGLNSSFVEGAFNRAR